MRNFLDAKIMAKALRAELRSRQIELPHSTALEIVARQFGLNDWNVLAAKIGQGASAVETAAAASDTEAIRFEPAAPIFRIFAEDKAREFYLDFLGFTLDWEHRFGDNFPLYAQVSRSGFILHLSGHHGDASPGATAFVAMQGVRAYRQELAASNYKHMKPGLEDLPWGQVMEVIDPFSNRIRFCERPGGDME